MIPARRRNGATTSRGLPGSHAVGSRSLLDRFRPIELILPILLAVKASCIRVHTTSSLTCSRARAATTACRLGSAAGHWHVRSALLVSPIRISLPSGYPEASRPRARSCAPPGRGTRPCRRLPGAGSSEPDRPPAFKARTRGMPPRGNPAPVINTRYRQTRQKIILEHRKAEAAAATPLPSCGSHEHDQAEARREPHSGPRAGPGPRGRPRPCGRTCSSGSRPDDGRSLAGERCRGAPCPRSVAVMPAINGLLVRSLTEAGGSSPPSPPPPGP